MIKLRETDSDILFVTGKMLWFIKALQEVFLVSYETFKVVKKPFYIIIYHF